VTHVSVQWSLRHQAVKLVQELGRRATNITEDSGEISDTADGNAVSFQNTFTASYSLFQTSLAYSAFALFSLQCLVPCSSHNKLISKKHNGNKMAGTTFTD